MRSFLNGHPAEATQTRQFALPLPRQNFVKPYLDSALKLTGGKAKAYGDYRRLLENKDVQAVMIATPEHWHAIMCIDACEAGKDVYVEKPASHHIRDGRLMVESARRNKRVVQVGTQQRSGAHFQRVVKYVQEGRIGEVCYATVWTHFPMARPQSNVTGGPPPGMDWEMWLGPAPKLPYDEVLRQKPEAAHRGHRSRSSCEYCLQTRQHRLSCGTQAALGRREGTGHSRR